MPKCPKARWPAQAGGGDESPVDVEPEPPLDVETEKHDVRPLRLGLHGPVDLFRAEDPESVP